MSEYNEAIKLAAYDEVSEDKLPTANDILDECKDKPKKAAVRPIIAIGQG